MNIDLSGRVAVVTGGGQGIGRATVFALARAGAHVEVWDREDATAVVEAARDSGGSAAAALVDVAEPDQITAAATELLGRLGRADILVNNAGIVRDAQLAKMQQQQFDAVIAVNLAGVFHCTQALVPTMIARRWGRIVAASSVVGLYGNFGQTNYAAAKAGVIGMTRVWSRELGKHGITANVVAPGFVDTEMARGVPERVLQMVLEHTPAGRLGRPEEVAAAYVFLCSEQAAFINGAVLGVDGGLVLGT